MGQGQGGPSARRGLEVANSSAPSSQTSRPLVMPKERKGSGDWDRKNEPVSGSSAPTPRERKVVLFTPLHVSGRLFAFIIFVSFCFAFIFKGYSIKTILVSQVL